MARDDGLTEDQMNAIIAALGEHQPWRHLGWMWRDDTETPRELHAGAVIRSLVFPGQYRIEAITAQGQEGYEGAYRVEAGDAQSDGGAFVIQVGWGGDEEHNIGDVRAEISAPRGDCDVVLDEPADVASESQDLVGERVDELLRLLQDARGIRRRQLVCEAEVTPFEPHERDALLPILWQYILDKRDSNDRDELVAVASAIRKYIALLPMERLGELTVLLEPGHRAPLPLELELEVAKMVYRNYEVHPPAVPDPQPQLASRLWEMAQAYINPRVLLRDQHAAVTSLAIEALVAMRSGLAERAWRGAIESPYRWFGEVVTDDLAELRERWIERNEDAVTWLDELRMRVVSGV